MTRCPNCDVEMVQSPIETLVLCPIPGCGWLHGSVPWRRETFMVEAEIVRSEELRVDRLGPTEEDVIPDLVHGSAIRPSRSLDAT